MEIYRHIFSPIEVNTYVLADKSGDCAVIDCGCYSENEFRKLEDFIESRRLKPVLLLNTHCHLDHVFGNRFILEKYKLRSFFCEDDEYNRMNAVNIARLFGLVMETPPEPEGFLTDGQVITLGEISLKALHVPGHSKGSLSFYSEQDGVVFTGDALFSGSIGRTDLPGGDYGTLIKSISDKLFTLPPETIVYPGHGGSTTIEKETKTNPYFNQQ
jgi:glyoxylase-like metal-dependent hydrolase (beta-lactamase superfamily II)